MIKQAYFSVATIKGNTEQFRCNQGGTLTPKSA